MGKKLEIRIRPDGTIESRTINVKGKECTKYMGIVEELLAARIVDSEFTPEYYETAQETSTEDALVQNGGAQ